MTPAERALLLAVAEHIVDKMWRKDQLRELITAVEAESAFAADDEAELAEVAAKARAMENIPPSEEYLQNLLNAAQAVRAALEGDVGLAATCQTCCYTQRVIVAIDGEVTCPDCGYPDSPNRR